MPESDNALGEFLRARRRLLAPEELGLVADDYRRRRQPGLRREELAFLAGVSSHYYARLERGEARHPSPAVLDALAAVLRLDAGATTHLHRLAQPVSRARTRARAASRRPERASPGLVRTPMSEPFYQNPQVLQRRSAAIPLGRIGSPEDMAQVVLFLASDRAAFVNGQEIIVDGGFEHMLMSLVPRPGFERGN